MEGKSLQCSLLEGPFQSNKTKQAAAHGFEHKLAKAMRQPILPNKQDLHFINETPTYVSLDKTAS